MVGRLETVAAKCQNIFVTQMPKIQQRKKAGIKERSAVIVGQADMERTRTTKCKTEGGISMTKCRDTRTCSF